MAQNARRCRDQRRVRALQHRACPPSAVVTAARSQFPGIGLAGRGVASWAARPAAGEPHTRNAQTRALGTLSHTLDRARPQARCITPATLTYAVSGEIFANVPGRIPDVGHSPPQALAPLAAGKDLTIRSAVGRHLDSPLCALAALARDTDHRVRRPVARNPACSLRVLARWARDPSNEARAAATDPLFVNILKDFDNDWARRCGRCRRLATRHTFRCDAANAASKPCPGSLPTPNTYYTSVSSARTRRR